MVMLDTRIKLLLLFLINLMVFGLKDITLGSICFCAVCVLCCLLGQQQKVGKYICYYIIIVLLYWGCKYIPQPLHSILAIFTLFIRVMIPVILFASVFIATTKVSEMIAAMYAMKVPRSITITFTMTLRFFPTLNEEIHNIYSAMRIRGISLSFKNVFTRPMLLLESLLVPIVMRCASIAEELSASAETRGIDNPEKRTSFITLKIRVCDVTLLIGFIVLFIALFYLKYQIYGRI